VEFDGSQLVDPTIKKFGFGPKNNYMCVHLNTMNYTGGRGGTTQGI